MRGTEHTGVAEPYGITARYPAWSRSHPHAPLVISRTVLRTF